MRTFEILPLLNYRYRYVGFGILFFAALLMCIKEIHLKVLPLNSDLNFLLASIGLFFLTFAKSKNENVRIEKLRYNSFKIAFGLMMSVMIAISLTGLITEYQLLEINMIYLIFAGLLTHNLAFMILKRLTN